MTERLWAGLFSVAAFFAAGAAAARWLAARHPAAFAVDFAAPLVVATAWGGYGSLCFAILGVTILGATLALLGVVRGGAPPAPAGPIALAAAAALGAAAAWPFVFSSDVYAYAAYGALAAHGLDPYVPAPGASHDPFVAAARWQWGGAGFPACVYGPAFVALARFVVVATGGTHVWAALAALRLLACGAFIGCIFALDAALAGTTPRRRFATLAAVGLNPVAVWSVAEGHNDAFVLLPALLGFVLVRRGASVLGALLVGLGPLVKATGAAFAGALALELLAFAPVRWKSSLAGLALGLGAAVALALPPVIPALRAVRTAGHYAPTLSLQSALGVVPAAVLALASAAYGVVRLRGRARDGHAWLGIAVWIALPNPYPWYALWFLPAVAAAGSGAAAAGLYGVTISSVVRYLPDAFGQLGPGALRAAAAAEALPLLLALAPLARPLLRRKTTSVT